MGAKIHIKQKKKKNNNIASQRTLFIVRNSQVALLFLKMINFCQVFNRMSLKLINNPASSIPNINTVLL